LLIESCISHRPTKFEFVLNFRSADFLGVSVPASLLLRADEVIE